MKVWKCHQKGQFSVTSKVSVGIRQIGPREKTGSIPAKERIPSSAITASSLSSCYWHHGLEILAMEDRSISDHADSV